MNKTEISIPWSLVGEDRHFVNDRFMLVKGRNFMEMHKAGNEECRYGSGKASSRS